MKNKINITPISCFKFKSRFRPSYTDNETIIGYWAEDNSSYDIKCPHQLRDILIYILNHSYRVDFFENDPILNFYNYTKSDGKELQKKIDIASDSGDLMSVIIFLRIFIDKFKSAVKIYVENKG